MRSSRLTFSASAAIAAKGNGDDVGDDDEEPGEVIESAPPLEVGEERPIHSSGLTKKLLKSGLGWETPVFGDEVTVHYVGAVIGGHKIDSSIDRGAPVTFKLGEGQVVGGLDEGIITMRRGERALFTLPGTSNCKNTNESSVLQYEVELVSWISVVDICRDGGIVKRILSRGCGGKPSDLDEVTVRYQAKLPDGSIFAETSEVGVEFHLNNGLLCPALGIVIKTMEMGEKATVNVLPKYSFGKLGTASIPDDSMFNMDIELVSFKSVVDITGDLKVLKKILKIGDGIRVPKEGESVRIRYKGMLEDGSIFENLGFDGQEVCEFVVGEEQVVLGLDLAAATMAKGEVALLTVKPEHGYGSIDVKRDLLIVPAGSTLKYEVEMIDFTQEKELWEMNAHEKLETASQLKECGNDLFKVGKHQRASKKYGKAIEYVTDEEAFQSEDKIQAKLLRVSCWLNGAASSLKLYDFTGAIQLCSRVLNVEAHNVKALYRRAQAYIGTYDLDLAELDVRHALDVDPCNREVISLQKKLMQLQSERDKRDGNLFSNMFSRLAKEPDFTRKKQKVGNNSDAEQQFEPPMVEVETTPASTDSSVDAMVVDLSANPSTILSDLPPGEDYI